MTRKPKIEIGPKCPRCACEDTTRERNYGRTIKDGRWWCMKCGHLWTTNLDNATQDPDDNRRV